MLVLPEPIEVEFTTEGVEKVKNAFAEVAETSRQASESITRDSVEMSVSFRDVATDLHVFTGSIRGVTGLAEAFGGLTEEQTKSINVMLSSLDIVSGVIKVVHTLTTAEWALALAKKARAIASAIAMSIESLGLAVPIIAVAAVAGATAATAAFASMPSKEFGGPVEKTGPYMLHEGEFVISSTQFLSTQLKNIRSSITENAEHISWVLEKLGEFWKASWLHIAFPIHIPQSFPSEKLELGFYRKASPLEFLTGPLAGRKEAGEKVVNNYIYIRDPVFRNRGDMNVLVDRLKRMGIA